jgi:hypothetical protein
VTASGSLDNSRRATAQSTRPLEGYSHPSWSDVDNADRILSLTGRPVSIGEMLVNSDRLPRALETVLHLPATGLLTQVTPAPLCDDTLIVRSTGVL